MKFCRLLLSVVSLLLVQASPGVSIPIPVPLPEGVELTPVPTQPVGEVETSKFVPTINVSELVQPAVVTVYGGEIGSGSIVSSSGLVLTVNHVVQGTLNGQVSVKTAAGQRYAGRVVAIDRLNDLALVQIKIQVGAISASPLPISLPIVRLAAAPLSIRPGEKVYAIGSPFGHPGIVTNGAFRRITGRGDIQTTAGLLKPGNSGGPLLNIQGELIGVNKGLLDDDSGLATSVLVARSFIARNSPRLSFAGIAVHSR